MAPVTVSPTTDFVAAPNTLHDVIAQAADRYPLHELSFISSSAHDSSIRTKTFSSFNQEVRNLARAMLEWGKPRGSIIVVYLTEHEDNMTAVWACLLAGYLPCLQPMLSAQEAHRAGHVAHINNLFGSATWLTSELGAAQISPIPGLKVHLFSVLKSSGEKFAVAADWVAYEPKPDDDAILFLTSGSTGFSKAVVHTHRTILAASRAQGQSYRLTSKSQILNCKAHVIKTFFLKLIVTLQGSDLITLQDHWNSISHLCYMALLNFTCIHLPSLLILSGFSGLLTKRYVNLQSKLNVSLIVLSLVDRTLFCPELPYLQTRP